MKINTIKNIIDEIEFYESIGKYQTADRILASLIKLAYQAKSEDFGPHGQAIHAAQSIQILTEAMRRIPECVSISGTSPAFSAFVTDDFKDCISSGKGDLFENTKSCMKNIENHPELKFQKELLEKCLEKLFSNASKIQESITSDQPSEI